MSPVDAVSAQFPVCEPGGGVIYLGVLWLVVVMGRVTADCGWMEKREKVESGCVLSLLWVSWESHSQRTTYFHLTQRESIKLLHLDLIVFWLQNDEFPL